MSTTSQRKRKTYSVDPDRADDLTHVSMEMGKELERTVHRQFVLDELIAVLRKDQRVYKAVLKAMKHRGTI